jgi:hypothetical protein
MGGDLLSDVVLPLFEEVGVIVDLFSVTEEGVVVLSHKFIDIDPCHDL